MADQFLGDNDHAKDPKENLTRTNLPHRHPTKDLQRAETPSGLAPTGDFLNQKEAKNGSLPGA
jgi:hypothetical protein